MYDLFGVWVVVFGVEVVGQVQEVLDFGGVENFGCYVEFFFGFVDWGSVFFCFIQLRWLVLLLLLLFFVCGCVGSIVYVFYLV